MITPPKLHADNGSVVVASIVENITLDGKLDDWDESVPWHPIALNLYGDPDSSPDDSVIRFRVGVDPKEMRLYVAFEVTDQSIVDRPPRNANWTTHDAVTLNVGTPTEVIKSKQRPKYRQAFEGVSTTLDGKHASEYSLLLPSSGVINLDKPYTAPIIIGYIDKDDDGSFTVKYWSPEGFKHVDPERRGDLIICNANRGTVIGNLQNPRNEHQVGAILLDFEAVGNPALKFRLRTKASGKYEMELPVGSYRRTGTNIATSTIHVKPDETTVDVIEYRIPYPDETLLADHESDFRVTPGYQPTLSKAVDADYFEMTKLNGLPSSRIRSLAQDPKGTLWIGTEANLARYDGSSLRVYDETIGYETHCMWCDEIHDRLWIAGRHDVGFISEEKLTRFPLLHNRRANCIGPTHDDRVLVGTVCGLFLWDQERFEYHSEESGLPGDWVTSTARDPRRNVTWIGTDQGLAAFDGEKFRIFSPEHGLADTRVVSLFVDSRGVLWVGTSSSLYRYGDDDEFQLVRKHESERASYARSFCELPDGTVAVGAFDGLLKIPTDFPSKSYSHNAESTPIDSVLLDRENQLWRGFEDGRLRRHDLGLEKVYSEPGVSCSWLCSEGNHLWFLQDNAGGKLSTSKKERSRWSIVKIDKQTHKNSVMELPKEETEIEVTAFLASSKGVYVGTRSGEVLQLANGNWTQRKLPTGHVSSICQDSEGRLWVATNVDVYLLESEGPISLDIQSVVHGADVLHLAESSDGLIAVGTSAGILVFDGARLLDHHHESNGLISNNCGSLTFDKDGSLWTSTLRGLQCIREPKSIVYKAENGLLDDRPTFVTAWEDEIWCGSNLGINRISEKKHLVQYLLGKNGFGQNIIHSVVGDGNIIWLAGDSGVWQYQRGKFKPRVYIDDIFTDESIGAQGSISVTTDLKNIRFHFHATSLKARQNGIIYEYRISGRDQEWRSTRDTHVELAVPLAGSYEFEVRATDRDLLTSDTKRVRMEVTAPYARLATQGGLIVASLASVAFGLLYFSRVRQEKSRLEQRVEERTAQLSDMERQLQHAQKMESLGTLASGVAHDFNNSLLAISCNAELAMISDNDSERGELISEVLAVTQQAAGLTRSMLMFAGRTDTQKSVIDIREAIQDAEKILRRTLSASIEFDCSIPPNPVRCEADRNQIQQVVLNLALNARDAMPTGGQLTIELTDDTDRACVVVRDSGHGMSTETQERIFEPFYTEKPRGKGTGLGLSVVHAIVKAHAGEISVKSSLGSGTEFIVHLPGTEKEEPSKIDFQPSLTQSSGRILIADDDPRVLKSLTQALRRAGYEIDALPDGSEVLQYFDQNEYDLVILDIDMPGKNGWESLSDIRDLRTDIPVILMSGLPQETTRCDQPTTFIRKPFSLRDFTDAASSIMSTHQGIESTEDLS